MSKTGGLRVFLNICKEWGLTQEQQQVLLGEASSTVQEPLTPVTLERLSYVFRVYAALEILLPVPDRAATGSVDQVAEYRPIVRWGDGPGQDAEG